MRQIGLEFDDIRNHGKHDWEYCNRHVTWNGLIGGNGNDSKRSY